MLKNAFKNSLVLAHPVDIILVNSSAAACSCCFVSPMKQTDDVVHVCRQRLCKFYRNSTIIIAIIIIIIIKVCSELTDSQVSSPYPGAK